MKQEKLCDSDFSYLTPLLCVASLQKNLLGDHTSSWNACTCKEWRKTHVKLISVMVISRYLSKQFDQVKLWSSQLWEQFLQLRREAWKIQDFNWVWTRDLAIPVRRSNQLSYEATDVGSWSFVGSLRNCKNCPHNCQDHSFTWFRIRSSYMIHFIYHFIKAIWGIKDS